MTNIDADYYGYMDDDDGLLIPSEEKCEREAIRAKIEEWKASENFEGTTDEAFEIPEMNVMNPTAFDLKWCRFRPFSPMMKITWLVDRPILTSMWHRKIMFSSPTFLCPVRKM